MEIRLISQEDDLRSISHIYEESWKYAYKGLIPQDYLDQIPKGNWINALKNNDRKSFVILEADQIIGTASYGASRDENLEGYGELISIYFLPEYIGKGYGIKLFKAVVNDMIQTGYQDIYLWVLEGNTHAAQFYERFGFKANGKYLEDNIGGKDVREIQYVYHIE